MPRSSRLLPVRANHHRVRRLLGGAICLLLVPLPFWATVPTATFTGTPPVDFGSIQVGASSGTTLTLPFIVGAGTTLGSLQALTVGTPNLDFTVGSGSTCQSGSTNTICTVDVTFLPTAPGLRRGAVVLLDQSSNPLVTVPIFGTGTGPMAVFSPGAASVISTGGVVTKLPYQIALDGAGNMYVGNYAQGTANPLVVKVPAGGGSATEVTTGSITLGGLNHEVCGVALDGAGNLFIADYVNDRIVEVTPGGLASVLSITGLPTPLGQPTALAVDTAGNLYIADYVASDRASGRIVQVTPAGVGSVVSTGSYTFGASTLVGIAVDAAGTIYTADRQARVVKVTSDGTASLLDTGTLTLSNVQGVAVDGMGNVYVADAGHSRIVIVTSAGVASVLATPGLASPSTLSAMYGVTVDGAGNVLIPDWSNNRLVEVNVSTSSLMFASTAVGQTSSDSPKTVVLTNLGNQPLVFSADPTYTADFSRNTSDTNPCTSSTTLTAGSVCDVSLKFTPQSVATLAANITLTDNTLNGTGVQQEIAVSGTARKKTATVALSSSANPSVVSSAVTFTATVSSASGTPTGSVNFFDGTTLLGSGTLTSGVATYATSSLTSGTHSITAVYSGDSLDASATSSALSQIVSDFNLTLATDSAAAATVSPGGAANYSLTVSPTDSTTLPAAVTFTATGLPTGATATFTSGTVVAGASATNVTLTINVPAGLAAVQVDRHGFGLATLLAGVILLPFGGRLRRLSGKAGLLACLLLLASAGGTMGCKGIPASATGTTPKTYTVTVTATSGTVSHSTTVNLTVK